MVQVAHSEQVLEAQEGVPPQLDQGMHLEQQQQELEAQQPPPQKVAPALTHEAHHQLQTRQAAKGKRYLAQREMNSTSSIQDSIFHQTLRVQR